MKAKNIGLHLLMLLVILAMSACGSVERPKLSDTSQDELQRSARSALAALYASSPQAKELQHESMGILVFPGVLQAGLIVGGSGGNGVLFSPGGGVMGYYNLASVSFGLQVGAQDHSLAMFLTTPKAMEYLDSSAGWSIGVGPTIVVVNEGASKDISTTTTRSDVYAFIYGQGGLMGGIGIQGQKITKLRP